MSLNATVTAAVNKAFTALGDLVDSGTLSSKAVSGYDFGTGNTISTTSSQAVDVIVQSTKNKTGEGFIVSALMKSGVDLSVYDTLTVNSKTYNIIDFDDNGFIIEAIIVKED